MYLQQGCYTWRHDSILLFIAKTFQSLQQASIFDHLLGFISSSVVNGDDLPPDLLLSISDEWLYISAFTVGFESNRRDLVQQQSNKYKHVKLINLSMSPLGIFDKCTSDFLDIITALQFYNTTKNYISRKITTIAIRTSYFIFCTRIKREVKS